MLMMTARGAEREISRALGDLALLSWETVVGSTLELVAVRPVGSPVVCSSIALAGPGSALVMIFAERRLALMGTATALGTPPAAVGDRDIQDVLGEVVNIIGGNLKGVLSEIPGEWQLTLPVVSNAMQHSPGSHVVAEVCCMSGGAVLGCRILEDG